MIIKGQQYGWKCITTFSPTPKDGNKEFLPKEFKRGDLIPSWLYASLIKPERMNFERNYTTGDVIATPLTNPNKT